jgi:hypothetical protein
LTALLQLVQFTEGEARKPSRGGALYFAAPEMVFSFN